MDLFDRPAATERAEQIPHPAIAWNRQSLSQRAIVFLIHHRGREQETRASQFERSHALHERFLEGAADGHRLPDRLHLRGQRPIRLRELFEIPARNLDDHVVDRGFERRGRDARDVVGNFVQVIAERELGGNFGDRESGGLRRQRGRPRHARVHLDDDHPAVRRVHRKLDVRSAGLDADLADDLARRVAHPLVFLVAQRENRRDGDAVARMHAHRIDVLNRADDDEVVGDVAHHLELELFPADDRLFDQHLVDRAQLEPALRKVAELFDVVRDAAADAPQGERWPDDERKAQRPREIHRLIWGSREPALRHVEANRPHGVFEQLPILGHFDGVDRRADQLDVVFLEHARVREIDGEVERGLTADGWKDRVRPLPRDDRFEKRHRQRLDVRAVGELGVGHDRRRVAVHQDDLEPFGAKRLARLRTRVVELAGLSDHNRTGSDHQHALQICASGHLTWRVEGGGWGSGRNGWLSARFQPLPLTPLSTAIPSLLQSAE